MNTYYTWDDFVASFGREMREAGELYEQMAEGGAQENEMAPFDCTFDSDSESNLIALKKALIQRYEYEVGEIEPANELFELNATTHPFPITGDNVMYWILDMAKLGQEFDSKLVAYGAPTGGQDVSFPTIIKDKEDEYFESGLAAYNRGNRSGALFNWSLVVAINPKNADAYYSRAVVKNELHTWKAAIRDYDKAIELEPKYSAALVNRGSVKDENDDPGGAIEDYDKVIAIIPHDRRQVAMAYFNRGNSKLRLKDQKGACEDWRKARELGADYADEQIREHCN